MSCSVAVRAAPASVAAAPVHTFGTAALIDISSAYTVARFDDMASKAAA
jgi:hypothetical protein